jgi:hypothetical protein
MDAHLHYLLAEKCNRAYYASGCQVWSHQETDILVDFNGTTCDLAIRGTEFNQAWPFNWSWTALRKCRDVVRNLRFIPWREPISQQWMHKGFGVSAYDWFVHHQFRLPKEGVRYRLAGHSLGAGIAPHLARIMVLKGFAVEEVVLFGEPKGHYLGSRGNFQSLGIPVVRTYRNRRDWIRFAGVGRLTANPILLDPGPLGPRKSHNIDVYMRAILNYMHR